MDDRITVGTITRPQGVRGELKVLPLTDDLKRFKSLKKVYIDDKSYTVTKARISNVDVYLTLEEIIDRNAAELLRNKDILIDRADAVKLEEGRYFIVDLLKCCVYKEDVLIGKMSNVLQYGSADVYVIKTVENKEVMVPAIKRLIKQVDIDNKKIIFDAAVYEDLVTDEN